MADYDVGVTGLASPPAQAVITAYRPAVSVRNNGIHDALAYGTLRIYTAGSVIFTTELYSATIPPGETRQAQAVNYWTPPAVGAYLIIADVTCERDQYEPNNHLPPTTVVVTSAPPPPPPAVTPHAAQHEEGGTDEISVDGLAGRLKEPQVPFNHASNHEVGGSDTLDVTQLPGLLHDPQMPLAHGNESHTTPFATSAEVGQAVNVHNARAEPHAAATSLEQTAHKGQPSGYAALDAGAKVPVAQLGGTPGSESHFLRADQTWQPVVAIEHHTTHEDGGSDELNVGGLSGVLADQQVPKIHGDEAHTPAYEDQAHKGAANGYPELDDHSLVPAAQLAPTTPPPSPDSFLRSDRTWSIPTVGDPIPHATRHQDGGADELRITGLRGVTADKQVPSVHADTHGAGGPDAISLAGLHGHAADPQDPTAHRGSHELNGADELYLGDLHGELADAQTPKAHKATHQEYGADQLSIQGLQGIPAATGAEHGICPLDGEPMVPTRYLGSGTPVASKVLRGDRAWAEIPGHHARHEPGGDDPISGVPPTAHHADHEHGGTDQVSIAGLSGKAADAQTPLNHGATHQHEGGDDISISMLSGMPAAAGVPLGLATLDINGKLDPIQQPPLVPHHDRHELNGADEINVNSLKGVLGEEQVPSAHATRHKKDEDDPLPTGTPIAVQPGEGCYTGTGTNFARRDHKHRSPGGTGATKAHVIISGTSAETLLASFAVHSGQLSPRSTLRATSWGQIWCKNGDTRDWFFRFRFGPEGTNPLENQLMIEIHASIFGFLVPYRPGYRFEAILNIWTASTGIAMASLLLDGRNSTIAPDYSNVLIPASNDLESFNPGIYNYLVLSVTHGADDENQNTKCKVCYAEDVYMGEDALQDPGNDQEK